MRVIYVLAVICITMTCAKRPDRKYHLRDVECAEKSNFNLDIADDYVKKLKAGLVKASDEFYQMIACMFRNAMDTVQGDNNIHDFFMREIISKGERLGNFENRPFTRKDLENVANRCARRGLNDVEYLKCVQILESPFMTVLLH